MPRHPERTRQRQGRDFSVQEYLYRHDAERIGVDNTAKSADDQKTVAARLEQCRETAEQSAVPVDGYEPPERGR